MADSYVLNVASIISEGKDAASIIFEVPPDLAQIFRFKAGQYLTIEYEFEGKTIQQSHSIGFAPYEQKLGITIKRSSDGLFEHLIQILQPGETMRVFPPQGKFTLQANAEKRTSYYLIGAENGMIPLFSILKTILELEPLSTVYLLCGSRSYDDILYRNSLIDLTETHSDQFYVRFQLLEEGNRPLIYSNKAIGQINKQTVLRFLEDYPKQTTEQCIFISGPSAVSHSIRELLLELGIDKNDIFVEHFNNISNFNKIETEKFMVNTCKAHITLDGNEIDIEIKEQTILQTLLDAGYDPPFSCTSGVCTTCMAKLSKGSVEMEENYGLDENEVADGFILTCQSHPTSDEIELSYDV